MNSRRSCQASSVTHLCFSPHSDSHGLWWQQWQCHMEPQWATKEGRTGWGQKEGQDMGPQFHFTKGAGRRRREVRVWLPSSPVPA